MEEVMKLKNLLLLSILSLAIGYMPKMHSMDNPRNTHKPENAETTFELESTKEKISVFISTHIVHEDCPKVLSYEAQLFSNGINIGKAEFITNHHDEYISFPRIYEGMTYNIDYNEGFIRKLYIAPKERSKGYGTILHTIILAKLFNMGCTNIYWDAIKYDTQNNMRHISNRDLIRFYEKSGAQQILGGDRRMKITNNTITRATIYQTLEDFIKKDYEKLTPKKAIDRLQAIMNHIAPK